MNRKERMAAAILVGTLAVGILVDVFDGGPMDEGDDRPLPEAAQEVADGDSGAVGVEDGEAGGEPGDRPGTPREGGKAAGGASDSGYARIDINGAGVEELMLLPGIGPKKAEAVVEWRAKRGRFRSVEDLLEVRGIGKSTLERLRPYVRVGD